MEELRKMVLDRKFKGDSFYEGNYVEGISFDYEVDFVVIVQKKGRKPYVLTNQEFTLWIATGESEEFERRHNERR